MEDKEKAIQDLSSRLDLLSRQHKAFQDEIQEIQQELQKLRGDESKRSVMDDLERRGARRETNQVATAQSITSHFTPGAPTRGAEKSKTGWEEFIGKNLLNKVGIVVLVFGIALGAKYSIDHELLNNQTRIVLGYLAGMVLLSIAYRLRKEHAGFSAVLLSGGMTVLYFITYAAHSFYGLISQEPAFALMVLFTCFTVFAALRFNLEIIGIIGLVGAYAVPFLLGDDSGRMMILFSYMCVINSGILVLAFKKNWKRLYYLAFILTWLIFASWYAFSFQPEEHTNLSLVFSTLFFLTFYITFLAYKVIRRETLGQWDVLCMLFNSFVYFGYGYLTVESIQDGRYLGLFTVCNSLMHLMGSVIIYRRQQRTGNTFYFVAGMMLVFLTIAVPVQLDGNWVTLVWALEAALLFWIGRTQSSPVYEKLSYPLICLTFISLLHDWSNAYPDFYYYHEHDFRIFLNIHFFTSMLVGAAMASIFVVSNRSTPPAQSSSLTPLLRVGLPLLMTFILYVGIYQEIEAFWNNKYADSRIVIKGSEENDYHQYNEDLLNLKSIWLIMYSAIFAVLLYLSQLKWRNPTSITGALAMNVVVLFVFVTVGISELSELRSGFLQQNLAAYYAQGYGHILIRYAAILVVIPLLWINQALTQSEFFRDNIRKAENLYFHFITLMLISSELIHWLAIGGVENSFRLSLSILWGAYALFLIVFGLSRDVRHIRLAAIVLFAVTLLKLFAYDMDSMSTLLKTIVMIVLGALLLTASFIYNKYKRSTGNGAP